jgi:hypothetical protein
MAEVINLRMARKARQRSESAARAEQNRALSSRTKAEKARDMANKDRGARALDAHLREGD